MVTKADAVTGRRIYLDALEEAQARSTPSNAPKPPNRRIQDCMIRQLKNVEKERRIVGKLLRETTGDARLDVIEASAKVTQQMTALAQSIRLGAKEEREALAGLSEAQLDEVFSAQLVRIAPDVDDDDRHRVLTVWFGVDVADQLLGRKEAA